MAKKKYDLLEKLFQRSTTESLVGTTKIADDSITLAKLADIATLTMLGNNTGGSVNPIALTVAEVYAMLKTVIPANIDIRTGDESTNLAVANDIYKTITARAAKLNKVTAYVSTAPVGASLIIQINRNGTLWRTITIAAGASSATATGSDTDFAIGDVISVNITQVGSSTAGKGLKIFIDGVAN